MEAAEDGGGAAPGSPRKRAAAERAGRRGDAEQEEARTRLSMPRGRAAPRCVGGTLRSVSLRLPSSLARARVYRLRGAVAARLSFLLARGGREGEDDGPRGG
jgi:hypothetical protein